MCTPLETHGDFPRGMSSLKSINFQILNFYMDSTQTDLPEEPPCMMVFLTLEKTLTHLQCYDAAVLRWKNLQVWNKVCFLSETYLFLLRVKPGVRNRVFWLRLGCSEFRSPKVGERLVMLILTWNQQDRQIFWMKPMYASFICFPSGLVLFHM